MADPNTHNLVHAWIAETWLSSKLNQPFDRQKVKLSSGGSYTFPAVSNDLLAAATVHTSTASGKSAQSKLNKVRSDLYFLLLAKVDRRISVFTDRSMFNLVRTEQSEGRVPKDFELLLIESLPDDIAASLLASQSAGALAAV